nr:MAG TPA: hypothetical protein [Caudoviricetes sp.]
MSLLAAARTPYKPENRGLARVAGRGPPAR